MDTLTKRFIYASIAYMIVGMGILAAGIEIYTAFYFMQLYGFVGMMIFGISYHVIPRFNGKPHVHSESLGNAHFLLANTGIIGLTISFSSHVFAAARGVFFIMLLASLLSYAYNIHRTMEPAKKVLGVVK